MPPSERVLHRPTAGELIEEEEMDARLEQMLRS